MSDTTTREQLLENALEELTAACLTDDRPYGVGQPVCTFCGERAASRKEIKHLPRCKVGRAEVLLAEPHRNVHVVIEESKSYVRIKAVIAGRQPESLLEED